MSPVPLSYGHSSYLFHADLVLLLLLLLRATGAVLAPQTLLTSAMAAEVA
jgi:hypothetical protein